MATSIYPDLSNDKYDVRYAQAKILASDLLPGGGVGTTTGRGTIDTEENTPEDYILNQTAGAQPAGFWIDGNGVLDGSLTVGSIAHAVTDTDKWLQSDGGIIKYRTTAELATSISGSFIQNQNAAAQTANFWITGRGSSTSIRIHEVSSTNDLIIQGTGSFQWGFTNGATNPLILLDQQYYGFPLLNLSYTGSISCGPGYLNLQQNGNTIIQMQGATTYMFNNYVISTSGSEPTGTYRLRIIGNTLQDGLLRFNNTLSDRVIEFYRGADNDHQVYAIGVNSPGYMNFQLIGTGAYYQWRAGTSSSTSDILMTLNGAGELLLGLADSGAYKLQVGGDILVSSLLNQNIKFISQAYGVTNDIYAGNVGFVFDTTLAHVWKISTSSGMVFNGNKRLVIHPTNPEFIDTGERLQVGGNGLFTSPTGTGMVMGNFINISGGYNSSLIMAEAAAPNTIFNFFTGHAGGVVYMQIRGDGTLGVGVPSTIYTTGIVISNGGLWIDSAATAVFGGSAGILVSGGATPYIQTMNNGTAVYTTLTFNSLDFIFKISNTQKLKLNNSGSLTTEAYHELKEVAAPGTAASGYGRLYAKTDGILYWKDDAGTEYDLTAGAGSASNLANADQIATGDRMHDWDGFDLIIFSVDDFAVQCQTGSMGPGATAFGVSSTAINMSYNGDNTISMFSGGGQIYMTNSAVIEFYLNLASEIQLTGLQNQGATATRVLVYEATGDFMRFRTLAQLMTDMGAVTGNFATTNLTFSANRSHNLGDYELNIHSTTTTPLWYNGSFILKAATDDNSDYIWKLEATNGTEQTWFEGTANTMNFVAKNSGGTNESQMVISTAGITLLPENGQLGIGLLTNLSTQDRLIGQRASTNIVGYLTLGFSVTIASGVVKLDGDSATPGNDKFYGTNGSGVKGWYSLPAAGLTNPMTTLGDIIYGGASGVPTRRAGDTTNLRKALFSQSVAGVATAPIWDTIYPEDVYNTESGTYTPTATSVANLDSTPTISDFNYMRYGNCVVFSGKVVVDATTAGVATEFGFSLPISTTFTNETQCSGTAHASAVASMGAAILADTANSRATVKWIATDTGSRTIMIVGMYFITPP